MNSSIERYRESLVTIPMPGGGGCHTSILGVANRGIRAGLSESDIFYDIRTAIPSGRRNVPDGEIMAAIRKAVRDHTGTSFIPRQSAVTMIDGKAALQRIIKQGKTDNDADLWEMSPIRIGWGTF